MRYKLHKAKPPITSNYYYLISDNDRVGEHWFNLERLSSHTREDIWRICSIRIEDTYSGSREYYLGIAYECETKKEMEEHIEDLILIEELKR